jgi:hypothetical protein
MSERERESWEKYRAMLEPESVPRSFRSFVSEPEPAKSARERATRLGWRVVERKEDETSG